MEATGARRRTRMVQPVRARHTTAGAGGNSRIMQVSCNPPADTDAWYGRGAMGVMGLGYSGRGPSQPVGERYRTGRVPLVSAKGMSRAGGWGALALLALVLIGILVGSLTGYQKASNRVRMVSSDLERLQEENEELTLQLETAEAGINVGYEAAQRGMISSKSVEVISMTLPEN